LLFNAKKLFSSRPTFVFLRQPPAFVNVINLSTMFRRRTGYGSWVRDLYPTLAESFFAVEWILARAREAVCGSERQNVFF
jgi:hypothetical protein